MNEYSFVFSREENCSYVGGKEHFHNLFEIYYLVSGACNYFIDSKSYKILAGDLVLIPEGIIHKTTYSTQNRSRLLINCSQALIPKPIVDLVSSGMYVYRNHAISEQINDIFTKIGDEEAHSDIFSQDVRLCLVHMLLYLVARNKNEYIQNPDSTAFVEEIIEKIRHEFSREITLNATAKEYSISHEHLSRAFKKETGFGFNEYVTIIRLREAERMIKENPLISVSNVAYSCGFNDSNYFSYRFKKFFGYSPTSFKNDYKKTSVQK